MGDVVRVSQSSPEPEALERAAEVLLGKGTLVMPTDSVYGIGCAALPDNPAHERIFAIKRRDRSLTLPWLLADASDLGRFCSDAPEWAYAVARAFWPGALTLVVRASDEVPACYLRDDGTIALRVPDSELVRALARMVGVPLPTTSANLHGLPAAGSFSDLDPRLVAEADLTLDAGELPLGVASTIVDCTAGRPRIVREGPIAPGAIEEVAHGARGHSVSLS